MDLVTQAEYARRVGVSKVAVHKWVKAGIIPLRDGLVNPDEADRCRAANCDPGRTKGRAAALPADPAKSPRRKVPRTGTAAQAEPGPSDEDTDPQIPTLNEARLEGEILKNKKRALELDEARGRLVDREKTKRAVFALARQEREQWQNWPARIAPLMAAELGIETKKLQGALDRLVREHLAEIADAPLRLRIK